MIDTLLLVFGLILITEGLAPALFPNRWRKYLLKLTEQSTANIRNTGLFILTLGVILLWLAK